MPDNTESSRPVSATAVSASGARRTQWKAAAIAVLFSLILVIPRLRRLRRRVWAWAVVRCAALVLGAVLVWRFARGHSSLASLLFGAALFAFGVLVKARPQTKSVDDMSRELGALVALNGGSWVQADGTKPIRSVTIFVLPDRLIVCRSAKERAAKEQVAEISIADLQQVQVVSEPAGTSVVELVCGHARTSRFRYTGTFADHLARVAKDTIINVWKKNLPVLPS